MTNLSANRSHFQRAYASSIRARWDYFSGDHTLEDMCTAKYFRTHMSILSPGDLILAIDRDEQEMQLRVQYIDEELAEVGIAIDRQVNYEPVGTEAGFQIRHAGGRGRGTRYQIVNAEGVPVVDNIAGKQTAERELAALTEQAAA